MKRANSAVMLFAMLAVLLTSMLYAPPVLAAPEDEPTSAPMYEVSNSYAPLLYGSEVDVVSDADIAAFLNGYRPIEAHHGGNFYIDRFDSTMYVHKNRTVDVVERLDVYFNERMHGITRTIPTFSSAEQYEIRNVKVEGAPFSWSDYETIRIGDANRMVTGMQHYTITYSVVYFDDGHVGYDRFYRDIVGADTEVFTNNVTGRILLDEDMSFDEVKIYSGIGGTSNSYAASCTTERALYVYNTSYLSSNIAITVDAKLPDGAYSEPALLQPPFEVDSLDAKLTLDQYGRGTLTETYNVTLNTDSPAFTRSLISDISGLSIAYRTGKIVGKSIKGSMDIVAGYDDSASVFMDGAPGDKLSFSLDIPIELNVTERNSASIIKLSLIGFSTAIPRYHNIKFTFTPEGGAETVSRFSAYTGYYSDYEQYQASSEYAHYGFKTTNNKSSYTVQSTNQFPTGETATLEIAMKEGVLKRQPIVTDYAVPAISVAGLAAALIILINKKRKEKVLTPTMEFYPPYKLNPAEVGYIIDRSVDGTDITSLIFYWASHGHLTVEIREHNHFVLRYVSPLDSDHRDYERTMFNKLWQHGANGAVSDSQLAEKFYNEVQSARISVKRVFTGSQSFEVASSRKCANAVTLLTLLASCAAVFVACYLKSSIDYIIPYTISALTLFVSGSVFGHVARNRYKKISIPGIIIAVFFALISAGIMPVLAGSVLAKVSAIVTIAASAAAVILASFIPRRTDFYTDVLGRCIGFKNFLKTAEKEQLEMLLQENPGYYFDILPYANVLGVSEIWQAKFNGLLIAPSSDNVVNVMTGSYLMSNAIKGISRTLTSMPQSSGSSFSGGFSGGGGGFSGGGGGGGVGGW